MTVTSQIVDRRTSRSAARIFVGIKLAQDIAGEFHERARRIESSEVRLVPAVDLHLTLVPPWNEENIAGAVEHLCEGLRFLHRFDLIFEQLRYGPNAKWPKLLCVECAATPELKSLQMRLLAAFNRTEERPFWPHVTLARISKNGQTIADTVRFGERLSLVQRVTSVELFQSPREPREAYRILTSASLAVDEETAPTAAFVRSGCRRCDQP